MRYIILVSLVLLLFSCKTQKSHCDAYSQKEIKKDHQI